MPCTREAGLNRAKFSSSGICPRSIQWRFNILFKHALVFCFCLGFSLHSFGLVIAPSISCPLNNSYTGPLPLISGTGVAFDSIHIYVDNAFDGIVVSDASGDFSYTPSYSLGLGMHIVKALAEADGLLSSFSIEDTFYVNSGGDSGLIFGPSSVCQGDMIQLQDSAPGGIWSSSDISLALVDASGLVNGLAAGTVNISYNISNICVNATASVSMVIKPLPVVSPISDQSYCNGTFAGSINFTGPVTGTVYSWSNDNSSTGVASSGSGNIPSFLAINSTTTEQGSELIVLPFANGCAGPSDTFTIVVLPTPALLSSQTPTAICSNTQFQYTPLSSVPGTNFLWNRPVQADISPSPMNGSGPVSEVIVNTGMTPVTVTYNYRLEAQECILVIPVHVLVNPAPFEAPEINLSPPQDLCSGTMFQNVSTLNPPANGLHYLWRASNADIWAVGSQEQYALINFHDPGPVWVFISSAYSGSSCVLKDSLSLQVSTNQSSGPAVNYYSGQFICEDNTVDSYQWGYDAVSTLEPFEFGLAINQNFPEANPDFSGRFYWVKTTKDGCYQKSYYNEPPPTGLAANGNGVRLRVFPNPSSGILMLESELSHSFENTEISVTDLSGRTVFLSRINPMDASLDLSPIPDGFYIIHLRFSDHQSQSIKWIKQ